MENMEEKPIILLLMSLKAFNAEKSWLRHLLNVQSVASMVFVRFLLNAYWCNTAMHIDKVVAGDSIYYYFSSWVCSASGCDVDNDGSRRHSTWALAHSLSLCHSSHVIWSVFITMTFICTVVYYYRIWYYSRCFANTIQDKYFML